MQIQKKTEKHDFWSIEKVYKEARKVKSSFTPSEAVNKLESVLSNAVSSQMQHMFLWVMIKNSI